MYGNELEDVFEKRDLGVTIYAELRFEEHISTKVRKANTMVGLIRRCFSFLDRQLYKKLYITFVRLPFHAYDKATLPLSFQPCNRIRRKHYFQLVWKLPKDGTRGLQANSFYYCTTQIWNNLPKVV